MNITILDDYQNVVKDLACFDLIKDHNVKIINQQLQSNQELINALKDTEILVLIRERTKITEELLKNLPNLRAISQTGKISFHLDAELCKKYKIELLEGIGSSVAPAELTFSMILNGLRKIPQEIQSMKNGKWQTHFGKSLHGQTLGIWGYGKVGKLVANYAKAFGMKVLVFGSENSQNQAIEDGFLSINNKTAFLKQVDVLSIHLRLSESTRHAIKLEDLLLMKKDALFVNTSRAELLEPNALLKAINLGNPGFAAIDVYEQEPIFDCNYELLNHENILCTPHIGYVEKESYETYFESAFENITNYLAN